MATDVIIEPGSGQIYWNDSAGSPQSISIKGDAQNTISVVGYSGAFSPGSSAGGTFVIASFNDNSGTAAFVPGTTNYDLGSSTYRWSVYGYTGNFSSDVVISSSTQSTSVTSGALRVNGGVGISGRMYFNTAAMGTTGIASPPTFAFIGSTGDPIYLQVLEDNSIAFEGSQGQLFSITPNLSTGYIYSVNDITGIPLLRANANANVTANEFGGNFGIGVTNPGYKLHVVGSVGFTSVTASTSPTTGTLVVSGGVGVGQTLNIGGRLNLWNSTNTNFTSFVSTATGNTVYNLPATTPATGSSVLQSDSVGNLSWVGSVTSAATATTAQNINSVVASTSGTHFILFSPVNGGSGIAVSSDSGFTVNPATNVITANTFSGNISATGTTSGFVGVTDATSTTSSTTGALVVTGGVGIGQSATIGGRVGIGTNLLNAALNIQVPSTTTSGIVLRGNSSQTADAITYFSSTGATQFAADANGRVRLTGMDGIWSSKVKQNIFDVSDGRVNWNLTTWQYSSIFWVTANASITQASSQLQITNSGSGSVTGVGVVATGWDTGGANRVFGIVSPSGSERSYFRGYGNLVINPNNPNALHTGWNTMDLITLDISGTATTYSGNIIKGSVEGTERFSVGPFGNTRITVGSATTATGFIVKAVASQTGNLIETQSSAGATNFYITPAGNVNVSSTTPSTSSSTGALVVTGGVGIGQTLFTSPSSASSISGVVLDNGIVTSGTWAGTTITARYGGTGHSTYSKGDLLVGTGGTLARFPVGNDLSILSADSSSATGVTWKGLNAPTYGAFASTSTQTVAGANTVTYINFNTTYAANNVSIGSGTTNRIYINDTGLFDVQFSAQLDLASSNQSEVVDIWFVVDGVNVPTSNTRQTVTGKDYESVITVNLVQTFISGQYLQLAYSSPAADLQIAAFSNLTSPTRPDIPGVIVTVEPISSILPGSGLAITGLASLNLLTANAQTMVTGTSGVDFGINSIGSVHTFNIPDASTTARGLITTGAQTLLGSKTFASGVAITANTASTSTTTGALTVSGGVGIAQTAFIGGNVNILGSTASTYMANGALTVAGGVGISGQLSFNRAAMGYTGITSNPTMAFIGTTGSPITLTVLSDNGLQFEGTSGKLFGINNNLSTGWIFNVGDISGLPLIRANADGTVAMGEFAGNIGIGMSNPAYKLHVIGSVGFTSVTASTNPTSGTLVVSGGVGIGQSLNVGGRLHLWNAANTNFTAFLSVSTGNHTYTLPANVPSTGTSVLQADTSGILSWVGFSANSASIATTAQNLNTVAATTSATHYLLFSPVNGASGVAVSSDTELSYNPSTNVLSASVFSGNVSATAVTSTNFFGTLTGNVTGNVTGTSTTSQNINLAAGANNSNHSVVFSLNATGSGVALSSDAGLQYNPSTNVLTADVFSGNVSATAVTATNFFGTFQGSSATAVTSQNINTTSAATSASHYILFSPVNATTSGVAVSSDASLQFNPATNVLTVDVFSGNASGTAATFTNFFGTHVGNVTGNVTGTATTSQNVNTVAATTSASHFLTFSPVNGASGVALSSDANLTFNPSTNVLATDVFSGNVSATAVTSTNFFGTLTGNVTGSLTGTATTAQNVNLAAGANASNHSVVFSLNATGTGIALSSDAGLQYNPSTNVLTADVFSGNVTGTAITATNFYGTHVGNVTGNVTGTSTTSQNINTVAAATSATHYILFSPVNGGSGVAVSSDSVFTINPATNVLSASVFSGNFTGTAATATNFFGTLVGNSSTATTAANMNVVAASTNSAHYITFSPASSGSGLATSADADLAYNPSTNVLTAGVFSGNLSATAATATNFFGTLVGNSSTATTAQNVNLAAGANASNHSIVFSLNATGSGVALSSDAELQYNPSTNALSVGTGNITANSVRIGNTANTIDTSSGNLTLDSTGGQINLNDNVVVQGNLTVQGTTLTVDSTITTIVDPVIVLGSGVGGTHSTADNNQDRGIEFRYSNGGTAVTGFFGFQDTDFKFRYIPNATLSGTNVYSGTVGVIVANIEGNVSGTAITATNFYGTLVGNTATATTSANINSVAANTSSTHYILFSPVNGASGVAVSSDSGFTINPATNVVTAATFAGNLSATAATSTNFYGTLTGNVTGNLTGTATTSQNVNTVSATTSATHYLTFSPVNGASGVALSSDTQLTYNPATDVLSSATFSGNFTGTAATATNFYGTHVGNVTGNVTGTATTSQNLNTVSATTSASHFLLFSPVNGASGVAVSSDTQLTYNPATDVLSATTFSGNVSATAATATNFYGTLSGNVTGNLTGTATTAINTHVALARSGTFYPVLTSASASTPGVGLSVDGTDFVYNAATHVLTVTNIAGNLSGTAVTATNFYGTLVGNSSTATTASSLNINVASTNSTHYITFTTATTGSGLASSTDTDLSYNPGSNVLTAGVFSGNVSGSAITATNFYGTLTGNVTGNVTGTATTAINTHIALARSGTFYPVLSSASATTPGIGLSVDGTDFVYNAATHVLTVSNFAGNLSGTAVTSTNFYGTLIGNVTGTSTTSQNVNTVSATTSAAHYLTFSPVNGASGVALSSDAQLTYNPATDILSATTFSGNVTGTAVTATNFFGTLTGNVTGTATTAQNVNLAAGANNSNHSVVFSLNATGTGVGLSSDAGLQYNPSTNVLTADVFSGNASGTAATYTNFFGTHVGNVTGNVTGTATTSQNVNTVSATTSAAHFLTFSPVNGASGVALSSDAQLTYNPATDVLSATTFSGNVTGTAITATNFFGTLVGSVGTATTSQNINTTAATTAGVHYLLFSPVNATSSGVAVSSDATLQFNPGTNVLTTDIFSGNLSATAATATNFFGTLTGNVTGNLTGTATTAQNVNLAAGANNSNHSVIFSLNATGTGVGLSSDAGLQYNPSTNVLTADVFSGNFTGTAATATNFFGTHVGNVTGNVTGTATTSQNVNTVSATTSASHFLTFSPVNGASGVALSSDAQLTYNPATDVLSSTTFSGNVTGTAITATNFFGTLTGNVTGNLTGTATTAQNVNVVAATTSATHFITFSPASSGSGLATSADTQLTYNPATDVLSAATFSGNLSGTAVTATNFFGTLTGNVTGTATTAQNINLAAGANNSNHSVIFSLNATGTGVGLSSDAGLQYNPSTNVLTAVVFSGNFTGTAATATNFYGTHIGAVTGNVTGTATTSQNVNTVAATTSASHFLTFSPVNGASGVALSSDAQLTYNPATDILSATTFSGNVTGSAITATNFYGTLVGSVGSATTSQNINVNILGNPNIFHPVLMTPAQLSSGSAVSANGTVVYNPSTDILYTPGFAVTSTANATSTTTGSMTVTGGLGIVGNAFIGGTLTITNNTQSTSTAIGAVVITGGLGVGGQINSASLVTSGNAVISGNLQFNGNGTFGNLATVDTIAFNARSSTDFNPSATNTSDLGLNTLVWRNLFANFITGSAITSSTGLFNSFAASASTTTGALVVNGGVGIGGSLQVGDTSRFSQTSTSRSALLVSGANRDNNGIFEVTSVDGGSFKIGNNFGSSYGVLLSLTPSGNSAPYVFNVNNAAAQGVFGIDASSLVTSLQRGMQLRWYESGNANYAGIKFAGSGQTVYSLPSTAPSTGSSVLQSDPAGNMIWVPLPVVSGGSATATTSYNVFTVAANSNAVHYINFSPNNGGSGNAGVAISSDTDLTYNPSTNVLSSSVFSGNVTGTAITATNFYGPLVGNVTGTATTSQNINTVAATTSASHFLLFSPVNGATGVAVSSDTQLTYNPATDVLSTTTFSGNVSGTAVTATNFYGTLTGNVTGTATTSQNINTVAATTAGAHYLLFSPVNGASGVAVSSEATLQFNPATNVLSTDIFSGNLSATAATATNFYGTLTGNVTGTATTSQNVNTVSANTNATHYLTFSPANGGSGVALSTDTNLTFNSLSNVLTTNVFSGNLSATAATSGLFAVGALTFAAPNLLSAFQTSVNGYAQVVLQNSNSGASASVDFVVSNNISTDTGAYGNFGMNSSGYTGSGSTGIPNAVYLTSTTAELVLGTTTNNRIRFVNENVDTFQITATGSSVYTTTATLSKNSGAFVVAGGAAIGLSLSLGQGIHLYNSTNGNHTGFKAGATSANSVYTLPLAYPSTGSSILQSDTSGNMIWVNAPTGGSATPAGNNTELQYNNGGSFGGATGLTWQNVGYTLQINSNASHTTSTQVGLRLENGLASGGQATRWSPSFEMVGRSGIANVYYSRFTAEVVPSGPATYASALRFKYSQDQGTASYSSNIFSIHSTLGIGIGGSTVSSNFMSYIRAHESQAADISYKLPLALPGTGASFLQCDTSGNMSWVNSPGGGSGSPSGSAKQIQFNNNGAFGGAQGFEYITVGGSAVTVSMFSVAGGGYTSGLWVNVLSASSTKIGIGLSNPQYELEINGELSATNKSFVIDHPTKSGMKLRYGSLEGPENGVYVRGELKGSNVIEVPDHWIGLVHEDSYTVHLTPIGRYSQLYVEKIENYNVYVADNYMNPIHCYYSVWAERKDIPKLVTEY